jgi:DnaJ family protein C protein 28
MVDPVATAPASDTNESGVNGTTRAARAGAPPPPHSKPWFYLQMNPWESLVDKKIREAIEAGEFDNLAGTGEPIDLSENPFEDRDWRTAYRLLRNAGFAPSWIEERKEIDAELSAARIVLARNWKIKLNARATRNARSADRRWEQALPSFHERLLELNRRIDAWNLKTPAVGFQRNRIDVAREIERVQESAES